MRCNSVELHIFRRASISITGRVSDTVGIGSSSFCNGTSHLHFQEAGIVLSVHALMRLSYMILCPFSGSDLRALFVTCESPGAVFVLEAFIAASYSWNVGGTSKIVSISWLRVFVSGCIVASWSRSIISGEIPILACASMNACLLSQMSWYVISPVCIGRSSVPSVFLKWSSNSCLKQLKIPAGLSSMEFAEGFMQSRFSGLRSLPRLSVLRSREVVADLPFPLRNFCSRRSALCVAASVDTYWYRLCVRFVSSRMSAFRVCRNLA